MAVIKMEVDDDLVKEVGLTSVKEYIEGQLSYLKLHYLSKKIGQALKESKIDYEKELEKVRKAAWKEYQEKYLKDIL